MQHNPSNRQLRDEVFFFNQKEPVERKKRVKKILNEKTLSNLFKKFNNKFPLGADHELEPPGKTLRDRLGDLMTNKSRANSSMSNHGNTSRRVSTIDKTPAIVHHPNAFTDTRLNGLRFLTDDTIKELEQTLMDNVEYDLTPLLPSKVVFAWHSNWADLTEKCTYKSFPIWHCKSSFDNMLKRQKTDRTNSMINETDRSVSSRRSKQAKAGHNSNMSRLTAISEKRNTNRETINQTNMSNSSSINLDISNLAINRQVGSESRRSIGCISEAPSTSMQKIRNEMNSRLTHTTNATQSLPGCMVNYQLSNFQYREKGWTVITPSVEETINDNHKKVLLALKTSLRSIEEVNNLNKKNDFNHQIRFKLYGYQRRDQLDKYKPTNLRPKKSQFVLSIIRNELPKPLDVEQIISKLTNPGDLPAAPATSVPNTMNRSTKSATGLLDINLCQNELSKRNLALSNMQSQTSNNTLFNTQINDGSNCVYYPNGQLAICSTTVYGFSVDNFSNNLSYMNQSMNSVADPPSVSVNPRDRNKELGLAPQNVKNSFTTSVFGWSDSLKKGKTTPTIMSTGTNILSNTTSLLNERRESKSQLTIPEKYINPSILNGTATTLLDLANQQSTSSRHLLAFITPSGSCACYRENGMPHFICTEVGGYLCDKFGCVVYQWKWNELHQNQYEELFAKLSVQLNEFIQLEYKNPFNIRLKFNCNRESITFNLGSVKENQLKLHELINRTVSDLPMKSTQGNLKMSANARGATVATYKQQHRKASIMTASSFRDARIDKLLEQNVSYRDIPVMKELLIIQKKIRGYLEEWQGHCRRSLNILSPELYIFPGSCNEKASRLNDEHRDFDKIILHRQKSNSMVGFVSSLKDVNESLPKGEQLYAENTSRNDPSRSKSALVVNRTKQLTKQHLDLIDRIKHFKTQISKDQSNTNQLKHLPKKTSNERKSREDALNAIAKSFQSLSLNKTEFLVFKPIPPCVVETTRMPTFQRQRTMPALKTSNENIHQKRMDQQNHSENFPEISNYSNEKLTMCCPVALHQRLVFNKTDMDCKCRKQVVPLINDVEYDMFLRVVPESQLVVIVVTDYRIKTETEEIIYEIYNNYNRNRIQPCKESIRDNTRFLRYNITDSTINSDHSQSLLVTRHNVSPGMVLIYNNSQLVFCDRVFNGYGYGYQDFHKQLKKSREDALACKFLPQNFRFNNVTKKSERRTPWSAYKSDPQYGPNVMEVSSFLKETSNLQDPKLKCIFTK